MIVIGVSEMAKAASSRRTPKAKAAALQMKSSRFD
jgi:hypothetical protein